MYIYIFAYTIIIHKFAYTVNRKKQKNRENSVFFRLFSARFVFTFSMPRKTFRIRKSISYCMSPQRLFCRFSPLFFHLFPLAFSLLFPRSIRFVRPCPIRKIYRTIPYISRPPFFAGGSGADEYKADDRHIKINPPHRF